MPRRKKGRRKGKRRKYGGIKRSAPKRRRNQIVPQSLLKPTKSKSKSTKTQREKYKVYMWISLLTFLILLATLVAGNNPVLGGNLIIKEILIIVVFISMIYWRSKSRK